MAAAAREPTLLDLLSRSSAKPAPAVVLLDAMDRWMAADELVEPALVRALASRAHLPVVGELALESGVALAALWAARGADCVQLRGALLAALAAAAAVVQALPADDARRGSFPHLARAAHTEWGAWTLLAHERARGTDDAVTVALVPDAPGGTRGSGACGRARARLVLSVGAPAFLSGFFDSELRVDVDDNRARTRGGVVGESELRAVVEDVAGGLPGAAAGALTVRARVADALRAAAAAHVTSRAGEDAAIEADDAGDGDARSLPAPFSRAMVRHAAAALERRRRLGTRRADAPQDGGGSAESRSPPCGGADAVGSGHSEAAALRVEVLGMGAGVVAAVLAAIVGAAPTRFGGDGGAEPSAGLPVGGGVVIHCVELSSAVARVASEWWGVPPPPPPLPLPPARGPASTPRVRWEAVTVGDALTLVAQPGAVARADVVLLDVYSRGALPPAVADDAAFVAGLLSLLCGPGAAVVANVPANAAEAVAAAWRRVAAEAGGAGVRVAVHATAGVGNAVVVAVAR